MVLRIIDKPSNKTESRVTDKPREHHVGTEIEGTVVDIVLVVVVAQSREDWDRKSAKPDPLQNSCRCNSNVLTLNSSNSDRCPKSVRSPLRRRAAGLYLILWISLPIA